MMINEYTFKIKSCGITDGGSDWYWDCDGFADYDLWAVFRGKGKICIGDEWFDIEAGTCFLLPPNTKIHARHLEDNCLLNFNVHFNFLKNGEIVFPYRAERRYITNQTFFKELYNRIISSHYSNQSSNASSWLTVCLNEFFSYPSMRENTVTENIHLQCINEICSAINEKPSASLAFFAKKYGYSTTYLGKIFHRITGVSFSNYLCNARINKAKLLLKTSDYTVAEIAEELGYYDLSHFINQFKKVVGCSPSAYR
ncbi:MAG: helix-turn-helix domain-containing protein [Clostridia bacterium]|nr:helix-turn-helix domain-containing protein [Clostridia bacterium]